METVITPDSPIEDLDLPFRAYGNLQRNDIRLVCELLELSDRDILYMRGMGPVSLEAIDTRLAVYGLERHPLPDPSLQPLRTPAEGLERARWIGRQLDVLAQDTRTVPMRLTGERTPVEKRRYAWRMFQWAANGGEPDHWPDYGKPGSGWMVHAMPGSVELHLEALNRLAHEELGDE